MTNPANAHAGCLLVGEYVDEAELPANLAFHPREVVRPQVVASYLDLWGRDDGKEFTVLLKDGRVVAVRGQGLKLLPGSQTGDGLVYGIVTRMSGEEVFVALFKSSEVVGIFHGEMRPDRKIA
jgi:hypothetical protein